MQQTPQCKLASWYPNTYLLIWLVYSYNSNTIRVMFSHTCVAHKVDNLEGFVLLKMEVYLRMAKGVVGWRSLTMDHILKESIWLLPCRENVRLLAHWLSDPMWRRWDQGNQSCFFFKKKKEPSEIIILNNNRHKLWENMTALHMDHDDIWTSQIPWCKDAA